MDDLKSALSDIRHELKNPVNAIIGYSEMLLENAGGEHADITEELTRIRDAGRKLDQLISTRLQPDVLTGQAVKAPVEREAPSVVDPATFAGASMPSAIYDRLKEAVTLQNMTQTRKCLKDLAASPDVDETTARQLNDLGSRYDLAGIREALQHIDRVG